MLKKNKGFTLVELLVVIAIIGILAVVAVPALFKNIEKGKVADLEADISAIRSAALSYYTEKSSFPTTTIKKGNNGEITVTTEQEKDIIKLLEGLSFPFGDSYYLNSFTSYDGKSDNLILKIALQDVNGKRISEDGIAKLEQDLGDKFKKYDEGTSIIDIDLILPQ